MVEISGEEYELLLLRFNASSYELLSKMFEQANMILFLFSVHDFDSYNAITSELVQKAKKLSYALVRL